MGNGTKHAHGGFISMRESDEKSYKVIDLDWNLSIFFLHYDSGVLITFVEIVKYSKSLRKTSK